MNSPPDGVTLFDALDALLLPLMFVATTVNVYPVPFVSPDTVTGDALPLPVRPLGELVAVYVTDAPPVDPGVNATVADALPATAVPMVGVPGTVEGVTLFDAADADPAPTLFVAVTVNV